MAVEAAHLNQFPSHHLLPNLSNRENIGIGSTTSIHHEGMTNNVFNNNSLMNAYNNSSLLPLSGTTTTTASDPPATFKSDDYNNLPAGGVTSRKRSRDYSFNNIEDISSSAAFSLLSQDISPHINRQHLHLDNLIAHHMEKVRMELEEKRKRQARRLLEAIEVGTMKKLRAKEEEMARISKLNWALQEKLKSLCVENQIWRDLAHTNEATANALRSNLHQLLTQSNNNNNNLADDAQSSCCGSTGGGGLHEEEEEEEVEERRMCRKCGRQESCVLFLPCRHLCVCTLCASSLNSCPICKSLKTATLHLNLSPS